MNQKLTVKSYSIIGALVAMEIILSRFLSIHTWNLKIGFSFVPIVVTAMLFGGVYAGLVGAIGDIIGAILFPVGPYFPGFTITAFLNGVIFAFFLKKKPTFMNIVISVLLVQIVGSLGLNTFWISMLYGSPFWPLFATRIYQTIIMSVVQIVVTYVLSKKLIPVVREVVV